MVFQHPASSSASSVTTQEPAQYCNEQDQMEEEEEEETSFSSDEVITFNRVPFQNNQLAATRIKTYSDSEFAVPVGAPKASVVKARSKSMNAMCIDEITST